MVLAKNSICDFGWKARDFALKGVDGKICTLGDVRGPKGTLIIFICNHCPYVKASIGRIVAEAKALRKIGIGVIAIMPNDTATYREDSFDNMKVFAAKHGFTFPYVIDETQEVARVYGAQCAPDFFGFNEQDELQYRGRLDASRTTLVPNARRDLFEAMKQVAATGHGPTNQTPSMGMLDQVEGLRETLAAQAPNLSSGRRVYLFPVDWKAAIPRISIIAYGHP
jgi:peroxiredoxin